MIDGQRTAGRQSVRLGGLQNQAVGGAHFPMQEADGVLFAVVRAEGVGADHLGKVASAVGKGADLGPHFVQHDRHAGLSGLPGGFGACHAAADDV